MVLVGHGEVANVFFGAALGLASLTFHAPAYCSVSRARAGRGTYSLVSLNECGHLTNRTAGRRSVVLDLRRPEAVEVLLALVEAADVLVEGFRPGVMERLGAGPAQCHARNPGLVYGRMTGWGQDGPWASTADVGWMSVGPLEVLFYAEFAECFGLAADLARRPGPAEWPRLRAAIAEAFASRTHDEWEAVFAGSDACVAPVLGFKEAPEHPHLAARGIFVDLAGVRQPAPAPRFDRTPGAVQRPPARRGEHTREVLGEWGVDAVDALLAGGAAVQDDPIGGPA